MRIEERIEVMGPETGSNKCTLELRQCLFSDTKFRRLVRRLKEFESVKRTQRSVCEAFLWCPESSYSVDRLVLSDNDLANVLCEQSGNRAKRGRHLF